MVLKFVNATKKMDLLSGR